MKRLYKYIAMFFVGMAVLSSCADENEIVVVEKNEAERAVVKLGFQQQEVRKVINSRAAEADEMLYDLHFYVFNAQGKLTGYEQLVSSTGDITSPGPENVSIRTKTGQSYIYAVANINNGSTYYLSNADKNLLNVTSGATAGMGDAELRTIIEDISDELTRDRFLAIDFNRRYSSGDNQNFSPTPADNIFMMSGYLNDGNQVTIIRNSDGSAGIEENINVIKLYRILAKNTLTIQSVGSGKFTPKSYRLCNVPKGGVLIPGADISTAYNVDDNYTDKNKTNAEVESSYQLSSTSSNFTFYYPENLQYSVDGIDNWKERETNTYATGSKTFTKAPQNAAYIEILGDFEDEDNKITANVSYTIHLGNFSDEDRYGFGDFNVVRNNHYIYNVTVKGVNDIIVEAKIESNEDGPIDNPYAEGLVIKVGDGEHFDVDAHYEARVLTFTKASIKALIEEGTGYILNISTPFGKTKETVNIKYDTEANIGKVYSMTGTEICTIDNLTNLFEGSTDYRWMKFVKNTRENRMADVSERDIAKYPCKYPGDNKEKGEWLNVFELLAQLYKDAIDESNTEDVVYYTCFIDENYYADKYWSQYVNKEPRTMQIANNLSVSLDKKSVYAEVAYSISQRSIATFYTQNGVDAYGTEIIDEEDEYNVRLGDNNRNKYTYYNDIEIKAQDDWNGWTSAFATNENRKWYDGDNVTYKENVQPLYRAAAKACMSRNRDLNGDEKIDRNEVRWYLASVGQYRGLYFAQNVLPADARLINETELQEINNHYVRNGWGSDTNGHNFRGAYHYYTSSDKNSAGTFWPEEGLTNNPVQASWGDSRAELVRCVRTLVSNDLGLKNPDKYYSYNNKNFNLDGIKVNRNYVEKTFGVHNELDEANEFYTSFEVATNDYNNGKTTSMSTITGQGDPCANYKEGGYSWRTPNQKELALMLFEMDELSNENNESYGARTKFSGNDFDRGYYRWHNSPGFMTSGKVLNLSSTTASAKIRCVRDK